MPASLRIPSFYLPHHIPSFHFHFYFKSVLISNLQDPNWYKARREDGLEGMLPANFVKESSKKPSRENIPKAAVQLHKMP